MAFNYVLGSTPKEVFCNLHINDKEAEYILKTILAEGYSAKSICYAAAKSEEKLYRFIGDNRLSNILINEVRKNAWKNDDQRWNERLLRL